MCCGWGERESIWNSKEDSISKSRMMNNNCTRGSLRGQGFRLAVLYGLLLSLGLLISCTEAASAAAVHRGDEMIRNFHSPMRLARLIRMKRDAEVSFGNSQNEPRDKKSAENQPSSEPDGKAAVVPFPSKGVAQAATADSAAPAAEPALAAVDPLGSESTAAPTLAAKPVASGVEPAVSIVDLATLGANSKVKSPDSSEPAEAGNKPAQKEIQLANKLSAAADSNSVALQTASNQQTDNKSEEQNHPNAKDQNENSAREEESTEEDKDDNKENVDHVLLREDDMNLVSSENGDDHDNAEDPIDNEKHSDISGLSAGSNLAVPSGVDDLAEKKQNTTHDDSGQEESTKIDYDKSDDHHDNGDHQVKVAPVESETKPEEEKGTKISKRSVPSMIAENMGKTLINSERHRRSSSRTKRDLSYDDLREIIETEQGYPNRIYYNEDDDYPTYFPLEEEIDKRGYYPRNDIPEDESWLGSALQRVSEDAFLLPSRKEEAVEKEIVRYEVLQRLLKEKEEEQAKEAVLDYLIAAAEDRLKDAVEEEREAEIEEKLENIEAGNDNLLERLGEPPSDYKVNKRFPYSYEPYGGPWGAVVPGAKRSPSGSDWYEPVDDVGSYERLYRLAEALGDN